MEYILDEATNPSSNSVFVDSKTGKQYIIKDGKFIEKPIPKPGKDGSGKSTNDQNKKDDQEDKNKPDGGNSGKDKSDKKDSEDSGKGKNSAEGKQGEQQPKDSESKSGGSNKSDLDRQKNNDKDVDGDGSGKSDHKQPKGDPKIGDKGDDEESKSILDQEEQNRQENNADADRSEEEELARIEEVKRLLNDEETAENIDDETSRQVQSSRQKKRDVERKKQLRQFQNKDDIQGFIVSINNFIKNEVKANKVQTYAKLNKTYNSNTGPIIRRGTRTQKNDKIPKINVYFDQSGSWDADDIKIGEAAVATLNEYVKKKQLIIDVYKFANKVGELDEYVGGGTYGTPIIEHINKTKPDNVVVMTDSDIDDIKQGTTVRGGVWILWRHGLVSQNLKDNLHGKKLTKYFNIKGAN